MPYSECYWVSGLSIFLGLFFLAYCHFFGLFCEFETKGVIFILFGLIALCMGVMIEFQHKYDEDDKGDKKWKRVRK